MKKLMLCVAMVTATLSIPSLPAQSSTAAFSCWEMCGGCCACVRTYPGGPCDWQCC